MPSVDEEKGYRVKPSERHLEAAFLYLKGPPALRGRWKQCCWKVGFERSPSINNARTQKAFEIVEAGMHRPGGDVHDLEAAQASAKKELQEDLEELLERNASWKELAPVARRYLAKIGSGEIEASQGQVMSLREIVNRGEGRVGQGDEDKDKPVGVVVLPALVDQKGIPYMEYENEEEAHGIPGDGKGPQGGTVHPKLDYEERRPERMEARERERKRKELQVPGLGED